MAHAFKSIRLHVPSFAVFGVTILYFFYGATARGGPWPPLKYASKPLDPLLYLSIRLFPLPFYTVNYIFVFTFFGKQDNHRFLTE
jgi:hypothetical protein